jgi:hypothetical protein
LENKQMKRIQFTTRYKGGGGGTTTNSTIPEWARPYMEGVGQEAQTLYGEGRLDNVAGASRLQEEAFGSGADRLRSAVGAGTTATADSMSRLGEIAKTGMGFTGGQALKEGATQEAGQAISGLNTQYGQAGTLGSARNAIANKGVEASLAAKFADIDRSIAKDDLAARLQAEQGIGSAATTGANIASGGATTMANLGGQERAIEQQLQDADWQALNRYASTIYGNPARQQTVATAGGK